VWPLIAPLVLAMEFPLGTGRAVGVCVVGGVSILPWIRVARGGHLRPCLFLCCSLLWGCEFLVDLAPFLPYSLVAYLILAMVPLLGVFLGGWFLLAGVGVASVWGSCVWSWVVLWAGDG
jgi:hypothetical protein